MSYMNRRGALGEQMMVVVFVFELLMMLLAIAGGIYLFFGKGYDFRQNDAQMLNSQVRECISNYNPDFTKDTWYQTCNLNKDVISKYDRIKICKGDLGLGDCINADSSAYILGGSGDFVACGLAGVGKNSNYPGCAFGTVSRGNNDYSIITISTQNAGSEAKA